MAFGGAVPVRGTTATLKTRRLADLAPTIRTLLGMESVAQEEGGSAIDELLPDSLLDAARPATTPVKYTNL